MLLSAENVIKSYGTRTLLNGVSLHLERGDRMGVVGVNGTGKSTLLRILAGDAEPDGGTVSRDPNTRLDYLPQIPEFDGDYTVLEQVFAGLSPEARLLADYEAKTMLTRLNLTKFDARVATLSGGEKRRVALASVLVHPCDVLILDEPTNHLDSEMVTWLEDYLRRFSGALVMVTHDRYFLERVVSRIAELDGGALYLYEGSYEDFLKGKLEREESADASERKRQSVLRREYQWVLQGPTARGTKSRERLARYDALKEQSGPAQKSAVELSATSSRLGKKTIELQAVTKSFGGRCVVNGFDCMLLRDDRIGIVGQNGSGKSTLLNLIAGRLAPDSGAVVVGDTVRIGYFSQENPSFDLNARVIDFMKEVGGTIETPSGTLTATQLLDKFLFTGDAQYSPIGKLSGGERRRLFLLSILHQAPNVLLLDEPTNDLDLQTLTILEDFLDTFPGAVIAVSHDRYFLDRVVSRVFAVEEDGLVRVYPGGYAEYCAQRKSRAAAGSATEREKKEKPSGPKKLKFTFQEQREFATIEDDIAALEAQITAVTRAQIQKSSDYVALGALQEQQSALEESLDEKLARWVYLNDLAERIEHQ